MGRQRSPRAAPRTRPRPGPGPGPRPPGPLAGTLTRRPSPLPGPPRPRGPQEAPRPPAPPAAPSAQRPRQALLGSERGRPRAAAGAAGTCSSPAPAAAVAIAAPAPRASLCPGPAARAARPRLCLRRGLPRCPRPGPPRPGASAPSLSLPAPACFGPCRGLPLPLSLSASLFPSRRLALFLSVSLSLYFCGPPCFSLFASVPVTFPASARLSLLVSGLICLCLCLVPVSPTLSLFKKHQTFYFSGRLAGHISKAKALRSPAIYKAVNLCSIQSPRVRLPKEECWGPCP